MFDNFLALLASTTFLSVAITILVFVSRNWLSERLKGSIAHEYDRKLETLKNELAQQQEIRSAALSSLTAAHLTGYQRRLNAIEVVWTEIIHIRTHMPLYAGHADLLMPSELPSALEQSDWLRDLFEEADPEAEAATLWFNRDRVEVKRAFAGEDLFSLFAAYRAFVRRVAHLLMKGFKAGRLQSWHDDTHLTNLLSDVLSPEELLHVQRTSATRLRVVMQLIETKMLQHIAEVVSGEASATFNLERARRILAAAEHAAPEPGA